MCGHVLVLVLSADAGYQTVAKEVCGHVLVLVLSAGAGYQTVAKEVCGHVLVLVLSADAGYQTVAKEVCGHVLVLVSSADAGYQTVVKEVCGHVLVLVLSAGAGYQKVAKDVCELSVLQQSNIHSALNIVKSFLFVGHLIACFLLCRIVHLFKIPTKYLSTLVIYFEIFKLKWPPTCQLSSNH